MKTSSDHRDPTKPHSAPSWTGEHWFEMTATLSPESTEAFAQWLNEELTALEEELDSFVTPNSLRRSMHRSES